VAYIFGLALSSVTSTPAKALGLDDRIGYVREGYDADLVVWDAHPLSVGAAPLQVYIDGTALFNINFSAAAVADISTTPPPVRPSAEKSQVNEAKGMMCARNIAHANNGTFMRQ
jgi:urease alpha subunit